MSRTPSVKEIFDFMEREFFLRLSAKTGWGTREIRAAFLDAKVAVVSLLIQKHIDKEMP